jgi:hypothetical protein
MGVAVKHITEPVPEILKVNPNLPEAADTIIKTAMAKNRDNRYPTATALSQAMNKVAFDNDPKTSLKSGPGASASRGGGRGIIIGGVVVLVLALGAAAFFFRDRFFSPSIPPAIVPATITSTLTQVSEASATSTLLPATSTTAPTLAPSSTTVALLAPVCRLDVLSQFPTPVIALFNKGCTKKLPYTIITIPQGATFESQSPDMVCTDSGVSGGKRQLSCTGKENFSYDLRVCNPVPTPISSGSAGGSCLPGTSYDSANKCCASPEQESGCTIFKVDLRTCSG